MDKEHSGQTWVGNMYQKLQAVYHEVDEFVIKETVEYVENHARTVGESVKKFYDGVVQDLLPPLVEPEQHEARLITSERTDLGSVVGINRSEEGPLVPTEKCHESSHSDEISCKIRGYPAGEADSDTYSQREGYNLMDKTSDKTIQVHLNSSTSSQETFMVDQSLCKDVSSPEHKNSSEAFIHRGRIDQKFDDYAFAKISQESPEKHLDNRSNEEDPESDASVFEDADWGIENIIDLNLAIDKETEGEPSNLEISYTCNESTELMEFLSVSSHSLSSCDSSEALGLDNNSDSMRLASSRFALSDGVEDGSLVNREDVNMDTIDLSDQKQFVDSCVIDYKPRRTNSYKKIIQDAFMWRKSLTKEYEQSEELRQPTQKSPTQDLSDSEWVLL